MRAIANIIAVALLVSGCATSLARNPVPQKLAEKAAVAEIDNVRFWGDRIPPNLRKLVSIQKAQTRRTRPYLMRDGSRSVRNSLAISGGGSDGAYGAGVLAGWSRSGRRPEFNLVTGVSTGALTAPFAFLGRAYDPVLREIYTTYSTNQLFTPQPLAGILGGTALTDNTGLREMLKKYITPKVLKAIARQHRRGRRLLVATTNLDAQRPVVWDLGAIAASNTPNSATLFRDVLLASAALPGIFPPVIINVRAKGKSYQELHVDGGTVGQVFLLPDGTIRSANKKRIIPRGKLRLFVLLNAKSTPQYQTIKSNTISIASRSVATLLKAQGNGDVFRLYTNARRNNIDFNLAAIPDSFQMTPKEPFDPVYMKALFDQGYKDARRGYKWNKKPPGRL